MMIDDAYERFSRSDGDRIPKLSLVALLLIITGLGTMIMDREPSRPRLSSPVEYPNVWRTAAQEPDM